MKNNSGRNWMSFCTIFPLPAPPPENVKFAAPKILLPKAAAWLAIAVAPVSMSGLLQTMSVRDTPT
jgi:hypothetical protein